MLTEGEQSPADVIFAQDAGHLGALANREMFALPLRVCMQVFTKNTKTTTNDGSPQAVDFVYWCVSEKIKPEELPNSLFELSDPKWKGRIGWAPVTVVFVSIWDSTCWVKKTEIGSKGS